MYKLHAVPRFALAVFCVLAFNSVSAQAQVPGPWTATDVGAPALTGSATAANGVFQIDAAGAGLWGTQDQFQFVYQEISGDVDIRARVDSIYRVHKGSRGGVMIRASLAANAAKAHTFVAAHDGIAFHHRKSTGAVHTTKNGPYGKPPNWVRLVRTGNLVTSYTSVNGSSWTLIGSQTITLNAKAYVGLAVSSQVSGVRTSVKVSNVSVATASLPAGQTSADIGSPAIAGSASHSAGRYTVHAAGANIWDAADQFHYVYQPLQGDADVVARVVSLTAADPWSKAGIMIRESLAANSRHAMALISAGNGYALHRRVETGEWSEHTSGGSGTAPGWVRLVRTGSNFEAYRSTDGATWASMGSATIPMNETVYVGLAATSRNVQAATTAVFENWKVTKPQPPANAPPVVIVSAPANGATFDAPANMTITAAASDPDGTVSSVEFYANATFLGRDTSAPFSVPFGSVPEGTYSLKAVATDDKGASTISDIVTITVKGTTAPAPNPVPAGPAPKGVAFTASTDHHTLLEYYVLEIFTAGSTPGQSTPVTTSNLGKPTPAANGDVTVDRSALFEALAPGNYIATVMAVGNGSTARATPVSFTR
jgi:regulation of enolase protein 1 (concanavalin A-like superfamily)